MRRLTTIRSTTLALLAALVALSVRAGAADPSFLWKVTSDRGSIYLAGSVHMLSQDDYPLNPAYERSFREATLLVEEVDFAEVLAPDSQFRMLSRSLMPGGQTLESVIATETLAALRDRLKEFGMPIEPLKRFKPWALALTLLNMEWQQNGLDPSLGLDRHFYERARAEKKPVEALETVDFQISRFDDLGWEEQDKLLMSGLRDLSTRKKSAADLTRAWKTGDVAALERVALEDLRTEPLLYQRLLVERNHNWLPRIEALFDRPGPALVIVGAAHLIGPDGLLASLKAKGYRLEQQ